MLKIPTDCNDSTIQMFGLGFSDVFDWGVFCFLRLHLFEQKYSKNSHIAKYYFNLN